jgi:hypothetical protein
MRTLPTALVPLLLVAFAPRGPAQTWQEELARIDRSAPPLIPWQRTIDDALALSRRTGKPLLLCVNMDGENASEAFAHGKYKDPAFAALVAGYVPVILSPNRHTTADYDEHGRRIECPRFGRVTCDEHIREEQKAFERWFKGQRVVPRHVGVAPDGSVLFDLYLLEDLGVVDRTLAQYGGPSGGAWRDLLLSRDADDRTKAESAYLEGDLETRRELLAVAASSPAEPYDLIRLGLADESPELRDLAARALAGAAGPNGLGLILSTLDDERHAAQRETLLQALERLGASDPSARRALHRRRALATPSALVDLAAWKDALAGADAEPQDQPDPAQLAERLDDLFAREEEAPDDAALKLEIARCHLALARRALADGGNPTYFLTDADDATERARKAGADPASAAVVGAQAAWLLGDAARAGELAALAVPALLDGRAGPGPASSDAAGVLAILGSARTRAIYDADAAGQEWPEAWLADGVAAYDVLAAHPYGTPAHAVAEADLLTTLGLHDREGRVLHAALVRFPASPDLHARFRAWVESSRGIEAFPDAYEALGEGAPDPGALDWFAGYAELIVAEERMRNERRPAAAEAYARAIDLLERSAERHPDYGDSVDHFVSLALAGSARAALEQGDLDEAVRLIAESIDRRPATAELPDGLQRTPLETLRRLRAELRKAGRTDLEQALGDRLQAAAPDVWEKVAPQGS